MTKKSQVEQTLLPRRPFVLAAIAFLALAGCGKKGPLEPPVDSEDGKKLANQRAKQPDSATPGIAAMKGGRRPPPIRRPKDEFFLDPLL